MIYTVNGPVEASNFGNILMHEHIGCISNDLIHTFSKKWLDKEKLADFAADILEKLKLKYDLGMFVDGTPIDAGRDVLMIKAVSDKSGIPIVLSTGLYYYPSMYTCNHSESEIASWFIDEFENGMEGTDIKPGILKIASDYCGITKDNEKRLSAIAIAQNETSLPIYVHSAHSSGLVEQQLEILFRNISNPEKIIIGHVALNPEIEYVERIIDTGCYICMDQCHCSSQSAETIGKTLVALCEKGYSDRILLSNDMCIYSDFGTRNNTGFHLTAEQQSDNFGYIFNTIYNYFIENGGDEKDWTTMFKQNPVKVLDVR